MKKRNILVVLLIALPLFSTTALATCNAKIISWSYYPQTVSAGGTVKVNAVITFSEGWTEQCNFLIESGIIPQSVPYSVLPILGTVYPDAKCCVGNSNYDDDKYSMDQCILGIPWVGCSENIPINLTMNAPTTQSFDECTPSCAAEPARCTPGFYWDTANNGNNYYTISVSTWSACWKDDPNHAHYDGQQSLIYVTGGGGGCQQGQVLCDGQCIWGTTCPSCPGGQIRCSDGYCRTSCACTDFWTCPLIWVLTGEDVVIIGIIGAIIIGGIIALRRKK